MASLVEEVEELALVEDDPSYDTGLATDEEKILIQALKVQLGTLLTTGAHANFPEVVGEYNLLRFLRGCERNIPETVKLFHRHIAMRQKYKLDSIRDGCMKILDEYPKFGQLQLPHGAVWAEHFPNQLSAGNTPTGHVIIYFPEGDHDSRKLLEVLTREQVWETKLHDLILRQIQMDRLTRKYNRLIKQVVIVDIAGASMLNLKNPEWQSIDKDFNEECLTCTHVEYVGRIFVINAGWIVRRLYGMAKPTVPKRTRDRVFIHGQDYRQFMMDQINTRTLTALLSFRKAKDQSDDTNLRKATDFNLDAGKAKEVLVDIDPGKTSSVEWSFEATKTDIGFSAVFMRNAKEGESGAVEVTLEPEKIYKKSEGTVRGLYKVEEGAAGLLLLRWSNKHSWWYSNTFSFEITEKALEPAK
jgi:hypothetical protein